MGRSGESGRCDCWNSCYFSRLYASFRDGDTSYWQCRRAHPDCCFHGDLCPCLHEVRRNGVVQSCESRSCDWRYSSARFRICTAFRPGTWNYCFLRSTARYVCIFGSSYACPQVPWRNELGRDRKRTGCDCRCIRDYRCGWIGSCPDHSCDSWAGCRSGIDRCGGSWHWSRTYTCRYRSYCTCCGLQCNRCFRCRRGDGICRRCIYCASWNRGSASVARSEVWRDDKSRVRRHNSKWTCYWRSH